MSAAEARVLDELFPVLGMEERGVCFTKRGHIVWHLPPAKAKGARPPAHSTVSSVSHDSSASEPPTPRSNPAEAARIAGTVGGDPDTISLTLILGLPSWAEEQGAPRGGIARGCCYVLYAAVDGSLHAVYQRRTPRAARKVVRHYRSGDASAAAVVGACWSYLPVSSVLPRLPPAAGPTLSLLSENNRLHLFYQDATGCVHELLHWWRWVHNDLHRTVPSAAKATMLGATGHDSTSFWLL